ncbi:MAG: tetraacyldisaccharide 4'-kinase [Myxococcota bacterium]|nr:tetraacyldisaccharide 4'-kinase [Myxococcota bacterium]
MKTPGFFYRRSTGPALSLLLAPLQVASWGYRAGAFLHARAHAGLRRNRRLACGVVSVGSPMVGGTGKTPLAARVASLLQAEGYRVALASRGYGTTRDETVSVVSDGRSLLTSLDSSGDEPRVLAAHAPGVPVLVARDRGLAGLRAIEEFGTEILVLDDGFGHHRLARDLEVVTLDGGMGLGNGHVLPRGPLREGLAGLSRADAVVVADGPLPEVDEARLAAHASAASWFESSRRVSRLRLLSGGEPIPADHLKGREVGLLCGIAYPASFEALVASLGADIVSRRFLADHHRYRPADVENLSKAAPLWIVTEKDAVKLDPVWLQGSEVWVLEIEIDPDEGFVRWLSESVRSRIFPEGR